MLDGGIEPHDGRCGKDLRGSCSGTVCPARLKVGTTGDWDDDIFAARIGASRSMGIGGSGSLLTVMGGAEGCRGMEGARLGLRAGVSLGGGTFETRGVFELDGLLVIAAGTLAGARLGGPGEVR